ncbi:MAG TPA: hypothetical protein VGE01_04950, partial [Fimbriimonas sp.]
LGVLAAGANLAAVVFGLAIGALAGRVGAFFDASWSWIPVAMGSLTILSLSLVACAVVARAALGRASMEALRTE